MDYKIEGDVEWGHLGFLYIPRTKEIYENYVFRRCGIPNNFRQTNAASFDEEVSPAERLIGLERSVKSFAEENNPFLMSVLKSAATLG